MSFRLTEPLPFRTRRRETASGRRRRGDPAILDVLDRNDPDEHGFLVDEKLSRWRKIRTCPRLPVGCLGATKEQSCDDERALSSASADHCARLPRKSSRRTERKA